MAVSKGSLVKRVADALNAVFLLPIDKVGVGDQQQGGGSHTAVPSKRK